MRPCLYTEVVVSSRLVLVVVIEQHLCSRCGLFGVETCGTGHKLQVHDFIVRN